MNKRHALTLFAAVVAMGAGQSLGQPVSSVQAPKVVALDAVDLYRARKVLSKFYALDPRLECYKVLFSAFEGNLRVDFIPKSPDPIRYEGDVEQVRSETCGRNVGYIIDKNGNPIRRIYSR